MLAMFLLVPLLRGRLRIHDSILIAIILATMVVTKALLAFTTQLWQFYLVQVQCRRNQRFREYKKSFFQTFTLLYTVQFSATRSLMSQIVGDANVGKVYSAVGIAAAVIPFVSNPVYRSGLTSPWGRFSIANRFCISTLTVFFLITPFR